MQRAFLVGTIVGVIAPLVGSFLVAKRYSALADTLSHVSLVGVAAALVARVYPLFGAITASLIVSLGIEQLQKLRTILSESILAIFIYASLGIVSILVSVGSNFNNDLWSYLFGSLTTVTEEQIPVIWGIGILVIICVIAFYRQLVAICLDSNLAQTSGIRSGIIGTLLLVIAALVVSVGLQVVGGLLIGGLMILPVVASWQFGLGFRSSIFLSTIFGIVAVWGGLIAAFYLNLATGGSIILTSLLIFVISLLVNRLWVN